MVERIKDEPPYTFGGLLNDVHFPEWIKKRDPEHFFAPWTVDYKDLFFLIQEAIYQHDLKKERGTKHE